MKRRNKLYEVFIEQARREMMEDAAMSKLPAHSGKPTKTKEKTYLTASSSEIEPPTFTLSRSTHTPITFSSTTGTGTTTTSFPFTTGYFTGNYEVGILVNVDKLVSAIHTLCPDGLRQLHPEEDHRPWAENMIRALR